MTVIERSKVVGSEVLVSAFTLPIWLSCQEVCLWSQRAQFKALPGCHGCVWAYWKAYTQQTSITFNIVMETAVTEQELK